MGGLHLTKNEYLLDTHALCFWYTRESVSENYIKFFDKQEQQGNLYISSISFWEIALLSKKGKIQMNDLELWKNELFENTNINLIEPTVSDMIASVKLPDHHKDPFDRLLIIQAVNRKALLVTKDSIINKYKVKTFWQN